MTPKEMKRKIELATERKAKASCLTAVVLANYPTLRMEEAAEVCRMLGLPDSYKHQIRTLMQVPDELEQLGFRITNS